MTPFAKEYQTHVERFGVPDRIELMLCDLNGVLRGKWLPGDAWEKLEKGAVRLPISTYAPNIFGEEVEATGLGITQGDPDGQIIPIAGTLKPVPWSKGNVAQLQVEMSDPGAAEQSVSALSSRQILASVLKRFHAQGLRPVVATELEFYIIRKRANPEDAPEPVDKTANAQNYDLEVLARQETILTEILAASEAQGLATDTLIAEFGPGQFEINFHHTDDALHAADTALLFHRLVRGVVAAHGFEATFMAKPYADAPGNGMHVHASVIDAAGRNIFTAESGVSDTLQSAIGGVLSTMREMQAVFAPHLNSYRRFQPGSFAPATPDWGLDNRSAAVRVPETSGPGARLEHRISGADVNPYLAMAAILAGILLGLENGPELPLPLDDPDCTPQAPLDYDWERSVARFGASEFAADVFGSAYRDIYATVRRDEISRLTSVISPVEYRTYLSRL